jgi:recombination protein RecA
MHDRGISREGDLIDLGIDDELIQKSGGHHSYGEIRLGNGRENVKQYLRDNPALMDEISRKILEKRGLLPQAASAANNGQVEETPAPAEAESSTKGSRRRAAAASE